MINFILFGLLMLALFLGIPSLLLYFLYKWLAKKGYKWVGIAIILSSISFLSFNIYTAIYPLDSFYFDDFKTVTSTEIPKSAVILKKDALYPDFHGKYISCSLIRLSKSDYSDFLNRLNNDKDFSKNVDLVYSEEFTDVMKNRNVKNINFSFARSVNGQPDGLSYIGFFNDHETIVVWFFRV